MSGAAAGVSAGTAARADAMFDELEDVEMQPSTPRAAMPQGGAPSIGTPSPMPEGDTGLLNFLANDTRESVTPTRTAVTSTPAIDRTKGLAAPKPAKPQGVPVDITTLHGERLNAVLNAKVGYVDNTDRIRNPHLRASSRASQLAVLEADLKKLSASQRQEITPSVQAALKRIGLALKAE